MYDDHYGLTGRPFQLTPDPAFWFETATHRKAMAYLGYGLSQGEGFIVVTGDPGAGKTTLVGHLVETIDPERLNVIRMATTQVEPDDLLRLVAGGLSVDHAGLTKAQLLSAIEGGLHRVARSGRRTLLIVDEAQSLPVASLEELRMLSNFQAGGYALLQIFLLGQGEFRARLNADGLEQLRQRVIAMHHLESMEAIEVEPYIAHRLGVVGWTGRPDFTPGAVAALYRWSGGVPRRLNQLMTRVLLAGSIEGIDQFAADDIEQVIADLDGDVRKVAAPVIAAPAEPVSSHVEDMPAPGFTPLSMTPTPPPMPAQPMGWSHRFDAAPLPLSLGDAIVVPADEHEGDEAAVPAPVVSFAAFGSAEAGEGERERGDENAAADRADSSELAARLSVAEARLEAMEAMEAAPSLADRLSAAEARLDEQDAALRRVLMLLVDWVEGDPHGRTDYLRDSEAA